MSYFCYTFPLVPLTTFFRSFSMKKHNFEKIAYVVGIVTFLVYAFIYFSLGVLPKGNFFGHFIYSRGWDVFLLPLSIIVYEFILNFRLVHDVDDSYQVHTIKDFVNTWIWVPQNIAAAGFFFGILMGFFYGFLNALILVLTGYLIIPIIMMTMVLSIIGILCLLIIGGATVALATYPLWEKYVKQAIESSSEKDEEKIIIHR